ncbi:MAG: MBL fold metallo-hydrolase [Persicimonas sp.]
MPSNFSVKFYGCRGSIPVSGPSHVRFGGATSCLAVRAGDREIILDAGSGLVAASTELIERYVSTGEPISSHIFITHAHLDHLIGLPYFGPLYMPDASISIWGPRNMRFDSFEDTLDAFISPPFFPVPRYEMQARTQVADIGEADVIYFVEGQQQPVQCRPRHPSCTQKPDADAVELTIECMRGYNHPKSGVNLYRVSNGDHTVVYATDTEGFVQGDRRLIEFARGADMLIHDAMYTEERYVSLPAPTQGYGHSTVEIATSLAEAAGVGHLVLFHHDPGNADDTLDEVEARGQKLFANTVVARDGLEVEL